MTTDLRQSRVHAVIGVSNRLRDEALAQLLAGWSGPVKRHVEPDNLARLALDISTASLFEEPALRVIRATMAYLKLKRNKEVLLELLGGEVSGGVVVLVCDPPDRKKEDAVFKALAKAGVIHHADEPDSKRLAEWLVARLVALPQGVDRPRLVAEALIEALGQDVDALLGAGDVLAIYRNDRPIDVAAVHELYAAQAAKPLWNIVDAVLDGKTALALEQIHAIGAEEPEAVLNALSAELRKMLACLETDNDAEAVRNAGAWGGLNFNTRRRVKAVGRLNALRLLSGTLAAARQLRQGGAQPQAIVETLVLHARKLVPGNSR